jgi:fumarate hydratase class II
LRDALAEKSERFDRVVKIGRTHLQDAVPMRLGQEFSGFAAQIDHGMRHLAGASEDLRELPIGGTAIGTGLNTRVEFGGLMAEKLSGMTGSTFVEAANHFEAQSGRDAAVRTSGALKSLAVSLMKIADDIRWLGSGPRVGLGELKLPPVQPGSSIMPGKVNPVMAEALIQVCAQVIGNDAAITIAGFYSNFQLNTMQPLIARNLLEQIGLLKNAVDLFAEKLVCNLEPDLDRIEAGVEQSLAMATALTPHIGYDRAADIAKTAAARGMTVRQIAMESGLFSKEVLDDILDPAKQTGPD